MECGTVMNTLKFVQLRICYCIADPVFSKAMFSIRHCWASAFTMQTRGGLVAKALRYKSAGRGFDFR